EDGIRDRNVTGVQTCALPISAGTSKSGINGDQDDFLESMGEAGKAVVDYLGNGERIVYVNVMNRLSVDCDCDGNPAEPDMHDIRSEERRVGKVGNGRRVKTAQ